MLPDKTDAANADEQRMQMMQSSLVERIADVDDERRRSAAQMHRALETHSAEITAYVRRRWQSLLLIMGAVIILAAVIFGYLQLRVEQRLGEALAALGQLEQRVAATEATPNDSSAGVAPLDQGQISELRFQMQRLGERIAGLSERVAGLANKDLLTTESPPPAAAAVDSIPAQPAKASAAEAEPETAAQKPVAQAARPPVASEPEPAASARDAELSSPNEDAAAIARAVLEEVGELMAMTETPPAQGVKRPSQQTAADTQSVAASASGDAAEEPQDGAASAAQASVTAGEDPLAPLSEAPAAAVDALVDALIEEPDGDEVREYQRLARRVAAPAVRPRDDDGEVSDDGSGILAAEKQPPSSDGSQALQASAANADEAGAHRGRERAPQPAQIRLGEQPVVLQLIGFFSRDLMDAFIERSSLPPQVYALQETFRGRPWHVLIHSRYPDRATARAAIANLPPELAELDLWVRELPKDTELEVIATRDSDD